MRWVAALTIPLLLGGMARAQEDDIREGEIIAEIVWEGIPEERQKTLAGLLSIAKNAPFSAEALDRDIKYLWSLEKVRMFTSFERVPGTGVVIHIAIEEAGILDALRLVGNQNFTRQEIFDELRKEGIQYRGKVREDDVPRLAGKVRDFYRSKGYYFAEIHKSIRRESSLVILEVTEGPKVYVDEVRFHGNEAIPASRFLGLGLRLWSAVKSDGPFIAWPFVLGGTPFQKRMLDEDRVALARLYRGQGFRDVEVTYDFHFTSDGAWVDVDFYIEEGPRYRIRGIEIVGNTAIPTSELRGALKSRPGDDFTDARLREDIRSITSYYGRQGYLWHPSLEDGFRIIDELVYQDDSNEVIVRLRIEEGKQRKLGHVDTRGNYKTHRDVILREVLLDPGEIMDSEKIVRTIARLQSMRYFETEQGIPAVNYTFKPRAEEPETLDWLIDVEEGRTGTFNIGGGLASNSGPFLTFRWTNTNFGLNRTPDSVWSALPEMLFGEAFSGDGQSLIFEASPGLDLSRFSIRFSEPDLFGDQRETIGLDLSLFHTLRQWRTHLEKRTGGSIGLSKNLSREFSIGVRWRSEIVEFDDIAARAPALIWDQEGKSHVHGMGVNFNYRDVDIPMRPTDGYGIFGEYFLTGGPFQGDFDFHQVIVGGEYFVPMGEDERGRPHVLAFSGRAGWSKGFSGTDEVPYQDRFFLGGLHSLRAFNVRGAGPMVNDLPYGGEAMWRTGVEYQFPLVSTPVPQATNEYEWMRGYLWSDWGGLGLDYSDDTMREVRGAAGIGVRLRFPFLPQASLDLSLGYPVTREKTDDMRVFQFQLSNL